ncbi:hypothetical protein PI124_g5361 [Phytophthora idaei]|nr:hypothetical protein PI125_g6849 [Phytophthora idaei]KAG3161377.1 hypothetical protein PI126_g6483 [Phytophthora idaei]KAG3249987.1 hypothetical protein PI124_g5361 [Phytophthora idaei]
MRIETGKHGEKRLCYYDLKLKTARLISLRLAIELVHTINANSPLFNQTSDDLERSDFVLILLASGLDENLHDFVHKKQEYGREAMRWSANFLPMLDWDAHHKFIELDLDKISAVAPLPSNYTDSHAIDMNIPNSPVQEDDLSSSFYNESNGDPVGNISYSNSQDFQPEDTISHKMPDDSLWGPNDHYDEEATIRRIDENDQQEEEEPSARSHPASGEQNGGRAMENWSTQRRRSRAYQDHDHDLSGNLMERPMSLLQRRVHVRNRSCRLLLNVISISVHEPLAQHSDVANFFVFLLVFSGLFVSTLVTGITWAKFSIPKASTLLYSDVLLLTTFHAHRALIFRAANNRKFGVLVEGSFRMSVVVLNRNFGRRETHELRLVRNVWPIINLCNTLTHIIDESSPLHHLSTNELLSGDHFFVVLFTGQDDIISDTMVARKAYHAYDILVNHQFEDNITLTPDGLYIDLDAINATYCDSDISSPSKEPDRSPSLVDPAANNEADSTCSSYKLLSE